MVVVVVEGAIVDGGGDGGEAETEWTVEIEFGGGGGGVIGDGKRWGEQTGGD